MAAISEQINNKADTSAPKLPLLFSTPTSMKLKYYSLDHQNSLSAGSGILTPPVHTTLASVPFKWEQQPGKPYCTDLIISTIFNNNQPKSLHPPPRLYYLSKNTKSPSTLGTLVLYNNKNNNNDNVRGREGYWWRRFVKRRKENGVGGGNFVISTSPSVKMARIGRNRSSSHARSHIWIQLIKEFDEESLRLIDEGRSQKVNMTLR